MGRARQLIDEAVRTGLHKQSLEERDNWYAIETLPFWKKLVTHVKREFGVDEGALQQLMAAQSETDRVRIPPGATLALHDWLTDHYEMDTLAKAVGSTNAEEEEFWSELSGE